MLSKFFFTLMGDFGQLGNSPPPEATTDQIADALTQLFQFLYFRPAMSTVICFYFLGLGVQEALEPKWRKTGLGLVVVPPPPAPKAPKARNGIFKGKLALSEGAVGVCCGHVQNLRKKNLRKNTNFANTASPPAASPQAEF